MNDFDPTIMEALRFYSNEDQEQSISDLERLRKESIEKAKNSTSKSSHRLKIGSPSYDAFRTDETCSKIFPEKVDTSKHAFKKYTKPESTISKSLSAGFSNDHGHCSDYEMDVDDLCCTACNDMNTHPGNNLVECQVCHCLYHQNCHDPKIKDEESNGNQWCCSSCLQSTKKMTKTTKSHSFSSISSTDRMISNGESKTKPSSAMFSRRDSKSLMENRASSSITSWSSKPVAPSSYKRAEASSKYNKELNGISTAARQSYAKSKNSYVAGKSNTDKSTIKERLWEDGVSARKSAVTGRSNSTSSTGTNKRANPSKSSMPPSKLQLTTNDSWLKGSGSNIKKSIKSTISLEATAPTRPNSAGLNQPRNQMNANREKAKGIMMKKKNNSSSGSKVPPARVRPGQL